MTDLSSITTTAIDEEWLLEYFRNAIRSHNRQRVVRFNQQLRERKLDSVYLDIDPDLYVEQQIEPNMTALVAAAMEGYKLFQRTMEGATSSSESIDLSGIIEHEQSGPHAPKRSPAPLDPQLYQLLKLRPHFLTINATCGDEGCEECHPPAHTVVPPLAPELRNHLLDQHIARCLADRS